MCVFIKYSFVNFIVQRIEYEIYSDHLLVMQNIMSFKHADTKV